ncbi:MAG: hypothetical protein LQ351_007750 [Letrouitia transgressa]|nr:MAG: hypothetical protein LQ351_007750 [Letrouitia transgressa]
MDYLSFNTMFITATLAVTATLGGVCFRQQLEIKSQQALITETMLKTKRAQQLIVESSAQISAELSFSEEHSATSIPFLEAFTPSPPILHSPVRWSVPVKTSLSSFLNVVSPSVQRILPWLAVILLVTGFFVIFVLGRHLMQTNIRDRATSSLDNSPRPSANRTSQDSSDINPTKDMIINTLLSLIVELQIRNLELNLNPDEVTPVLSVAPIPDIPITPIEEQRTLDGPLVAPTTDTLIAPGDGKQTLNETPPSPINDILIATGDEERALNESIHYHEHTPTIQPIKPISDATVEEVKSDVYESDHEATLQTSNSTNFSPEVKSYGSPKKIPANEINSHKTFVSTNPPSQIVTQGHLEGLAHNRKSRSSKRGGPKNERSRIPKWLSDELEAEKAAAGKRGNSR